MTAWPRVGSEAIRSLITGMKDTHWSWQPVGVDDLCRRMGWALVEFEEGSGAVADAGLGMPGRQVLVMFSGGDVDYVKIRVAQARDSGADRDRFIWDAFADAVAGGVAVLGEPTDRQHSEPPTVRWRLDESSTVLVANLASAVTVTWASNRFQDEWDRIAEALA